MKLRIYLFVLTAIGLLGLSFLLSTTAFASGSYTLISGPNGGVMRNGWYIYNLGTPTITIQAGPGSNCGGSGTFSLPLAPGGGDNMGSHTLRYFYAPDDPKANLWVSRDGVLLGTMCNQDTSYVGGTVTVWQGNLKYDGWAPVVSITSPSNNTNTNSSSVTVSGTVYDAGDDYLGKCMTTSRCSMIAKVSVNGVVATVNGETYSVNIPLNKGLNTLKAVATDNAGFTSESQAITVLRSDEVQNTSSTTNPNNQNGVSNNGENNSTNPSAQNHGADYNQDKKKNSNQNSIVNQIPTPVKAAAAGAGIAGISLASYLGWIPYKRIGLFIAGIFSK